MRLAPKLTAEEKARQEFYVAFGLAGVVLAVVGGAAKVGLDFVRYQAHAARPRKPWEVY